MSDLTTTETTSFLERATRDPSIDVAKLAALIELQERIGDREAKRQFSEAMNALQREMTPVGKDRTNPAYRSRYATYEAIDAVLRPLYTRHGFSVSFHTSTVSQGRIRVVCAVSHAGGHTEAEHELESGPDPVGTRGQPNRTEVQAIGSIVSYLKRYTLMAAFAVSVVDDETDDDGHTTRYNQPPAVANPHPRQRINDEVPLQGKGNGAIVDDTYRMERWFERQDQELSALTAETWDAYWRSDEREKLEQRLAAPGNEAQQTRYETLKQRHTARLFGAVEGIDP